MGSVGLVLGGGGITGAAYEFAALTAIRMATGWDPNSADVIIGTSAGATVGAVVRADRLEIDVLTGGDVTRAEYVEMMTGYLLRRARPRGFGRWIKHGILPNLRRPGLELTLGGPALFDPQGVAEYVEHLVGPLANDWPTRPLWVTAYDLEERTLEVFGTSEKKKAILAEAVAASSAVPMIYQPMEIDGHIYVDGGVVSGTSAQLLLDHCPDPLDFILIIAPMATRDPREGARFYESYFERIGADALERELAQIEERWPDTDVVVLRPDDHVRSSARPNPMSVTATVPTFLRTLAYLRRELAKSEVWDLLEQHLVTSRRKS